MDIAIGSVSCTPQAPQIGESVLLEVHPASGAGFDAATAAGISIDGVPGTRRYVQFTRPGARAVTATCLRSGALQQATGAVTVAAPSKPGPPAAPPSWAGIGVPLLQAAHLPQLPHKVGFAVGQASRLALHPGDPKLRSATLYTLPAIELPEKGQAATYEWSFGDGIRIGTRSPTAQHDFSASLDPLTEFQGFDVSVTSAGATVTRTLTFCNLYARLKRTRNELHAPTVATGDARRGAAGFTATMTVRNPEPAPIQLTARRLVPIRANGAEPAASAVEHLPEPITIGAHATAAIAVQAPFAQVPRDSAGFSAYFAGTGPGGAKVRVSGHFDLEPRERAPNGRTATAAPIAKLEAAVKAMLPAGRTGATLDELRSAGGPHLPAFEAARSDAANAAHLAQLPAAARAASPIAKLLPQAGAPAPAPVLGPKVGDVCDPDNLPANLPAGFVCQATDEQQFVQTPGRFMNARKGDVVLAPGGSGLIGGLLTKVAVPQLYSHSGLMTGNYDQITHCTASQDRIMAYPVGSIPLDGPEPTDGFRPDVVQYGWPGTITQTVENTVNGEPMNDPEGGTPYNMQGFDGSADGATIAGTWTIVPPMVVKPDPMLETDALRAKLHAVADDAAAHTGKFHYRFYGYTDPTIGRSTTAPDGTGWAKGTSPGVCSAFIWLMMKRAGLHLQGAGDTVKQSDLNAGEIAKGAKIGPATPDGLYLYDAAERQMAGGWLHDQLVDTVQAKLDAKAGILGGLIDDLTKIEAHVSNEFLNAFARDRVQTDDDDDGWKGTGDANAVSPDNIMFWNGPDAPTPGPFGYHEPLAYREPRYDLVTISRWRQVQLTGALSGRVTYQGKPVAGATVQLYSGKSAGSDANGEYRIEGVPYGKYVAKVQKEQGDRTFLSVSQPVSVEAAAAHADFALALPPDLFRTLVIDGTIHAHYTYHVVFKTEDKSGDLPFHREIQVGPYGTHATTEFEEDVEDAHAKLSFTFDWQIDKTVKVGFSFSLHDQTYSNGFVVPVDGSQGWQAQCSADNDDAQTNFVVRNTRTQA